MKYRTFLGKILLLGGITGILLGGCTGKKAVRQQVVQPYFECGLFPASGDSACTRI